MDYEQALEESWIEDDSEDQEYKAPEWIEHLFDYQRGAL